MESYSYYNEKVIEENSKIIRLPICMNLTPLWKEVVGIGYWFLSVENPTITKKYRRMRIQSLTPSVQRVIKQWIRLPCVYGTISSITPYSIIKYESSCCCAANFIPISYLYVTYWIQNTLGIGFIDPTVTTLAPLF